MVSQANQGSDPPQVGSRDPIEGGTLIRSVLAAIGVALVLAAPAGAADFAPGSDGLGDPFFPLAGNGGYDVRHYTLDLAYDRATNRLDGDVTILARAEQSLSSFNLD